MSPTERGVLVGLALFGVASLAVIGWGVGKHDDTPAGGSNAQKASSFTPPAWLSDVGLWASPLRPRLTWPQTQFVLGGSDRIVSVAVPASSSAPAQRFGTVHLHEGLAAGVEYRDATQGIADDLRVQSFRLPAQDGGGAARGDPRAGSIVVMRAGGTLRLICMAGPYCVFRLD